jgi:hypothetical protein
MGLATTTATLSCEMLVVSAMLDDPPTCGLPLRCDNCVLSWEYDTYAAIVTVELLSNARWLDAADGYERSNSRAHNGIRRLKGILRRDFSST